MWVCVKFFPITLQFFKKTFLLETTTWLASEQGQSGSLPSGAWGNRQGWVVCYLLAAEVAQEELHAGIVESLPNVKHVDSVASCQQLLHHVLPQEPRASDHCAFHGLQKGRDGRGDGCAENWKLSRAWTHRP